MFELAAGARGFPAEAADEPAVDHGDVGFGAAWGWRAEARPGLGEGAGGEAREEAQQALAGAGDAAPDGDGPAAEDAEAGGDEGEKRVEDEVDLPGEVRGVGLGRERGGGMVHGLFLDSAIVGAVQGKSGRLGIDVGGMALLVSFRFLA